MTPEQVLELYDFNAWANQRIFDACAALTPEQFTKPLASSFPSVRGTLVHIVSGEWLWFDLWQGQSPSSEKFKGYVAKFTDLASIRTGWLELEKERKRFLEGLSAADLDHVIEYTNQRGHRFAYALRRMLQHVVNHSTYHRGQVITLFHHLGAKPCATDYLRYFDWLAGQPED